MSSAENDARLRLRFHLEMQDGFWLALVVGNDSRPRGRLRASAAEWCRELGRDFFDHQLTADELGAFAPTLIGDERRGLHWLRTDGEPPEAWRQATERLLLTLNEHRDALRRNTPAGIVLEGAEQLKVQLRNLAPDLFSVRACILEPGTDRLQPVDTWDDADLPERAETSDEQAPMLLRQARASLEQAIRMQKRPEPGARRSRLAALNRGAEALIAQGWMSEAEPVADDAIELARELRAAAPGQAWELDALADALALKGEVARARGDLPAARDAWEEALRLRTRLVADRPVDETTMRLHADVARCHTSLGGILRAEGDLVGAETAYRSALQLRERLVQIGKGRPEASSDLALTWSLLGDVLLAAGRARAAREAWTAALALRRSLVEHWPDNPWFQRYLSVTWGRLAMLELREGDLQSARAASEEALQLATALVERDPGNATWQMECSVAWSRLGDVTAAQDDIDRTREARQRALAIRRRLASEDPANASWQHWLAVALSRVGRLALTEDDSWRAAQLAAEANEISEALARLDPANAEWQLGLAAARALRGDVRRARGDRAAARADYLASADIREAVLAASPHRRRVRESLERVKQAAAELDD